MPALLMTVVFTTLFDRISEAPGYNGVVLVALLGAGATSTNLTADLRSGYFDRLCLRPARPTMQLVGRVLFEATRGASRGERHQRGARLPDFR